MPNYDQMAILQALQGLSGNQMQQQPPQGMMPQNMQQMLMNYGQQGQQQQQSPSWLDALGHTMMMGGMMNGGGYGMGNMGYGMGMSSMPGYGNQMGQQMPANWWQKGLQGTGTALSGLSGPATTLGATGLSMGLPHGALLAGGGVAAGGLGNLLSYLGQPGVQQ